jgi:hypothetical protein
MVLHYEWFRYREPEERASEESAVALEMRENCERCATPLPWDSEAYICSHECTFCRRCVDDMSFNCPNCGGELVRRPRRATAAT